MIRHESRYGRRLPAALRDERGAVLILIVFALLGLLAICALAIDLGVMYTARNESQNVADGAALAGAGILIISPGNEDAARAEAKKFAAKNHVRGEAVTLEDGDIDVDLADEKVRVWVRHTAERGNPIATFFARVVGIETVDVITMAAAQAWPAGGAECLLPIMLPDRWEENDGESCPGASDAGDCLSTYDPPEEEPTSDDLYIPYCADAGCSTVNDPSTGWSPEDEGTEMAIKQSTPTEGDTNVSWYFIWHPVGEEPGGNAYRERFTECMDGVFGFGDTVSVETGNKVGPTDGAQDLIDLDPEIEWDPNLNDGVGCPTRGNGVCDYSTPRIRPLPMFDPTWVEDGGTGKKLLTISNMGSVFVDRLEGQGSQTTVWVYFLGYGGVQSPETNPDSETPIKFLRLVE